MAKFQRGAIPTPRHKLAAATPYQRRLGLLAPPAEFSVIPKQLSMWLNDVDGDCVTAEEAFAKAAYSVMLGQTELFVPDSVVQTWASQYGFLNGAELADVMDQMIKSGFNLNGITEGDGPYTAVDWTNDSDLCSAISEGPVKIGVASSQFDNIPGVGEGNGWFMTGFSKANPSDEDHCVSLCGYGSMTYLFGLFGTTVPAGTDPNSKGYLLFTWSGIGIIDIPSMLAVTFEAWLRNPTTAGAAPIPPSPPSPPPSPPVPVPPLPSAQSITGNVTISVPTGVLGRLTDVNTPISGTVTLSGGQSAQSSFTTQSSFLVKLIVAGVEPVKAHLMASSIFQYASDNAVNPATLEEILQFILQILPLILPLFGA